MPGINSVGLDPSPLASPGSTPAGEGSTGSEAVSADATTPTRKQETTRETVESLVLTIILFLILGFETQAMVIPTGSMATTLLGDHKEVVCPQCGQVYTVNARQESEPNAMGEVRPQSRWIVSGTCVNCRYPARIDDRPTFRGDRIMVMKTPVNQPNLPGGGIHRWDCVVFYYPEDPQVRYIKRLIGLPGETIRLHAGDVFVRAIDTEAPFQRARRSLGHQSAMQVLVNDDGHRAALLANDARWLRWSGDWRESEPGTYLRGAANQAADGEPWAELRYRHLVPTPDQWSAIEQGRPLPSPPRPSLITDFQSYNTDLTADGVEDPRQAARAWYQTHWVGDLTLECQLRVNSPRGEARIDLARGGVVYRCLIDLATGQAQLFADDQPLGDPVPTPITTAGTYRLAFANVDERLTLWVNDQTPFGEGLVYGNGTLERPRPTAGDLSPATVATRGADVALSGLVLKRDVYYTRNPARSDYDENWPRAPWDSASLFEMLSEPQEFQGLDPGEARDFPIRPGHYFFMGDNSPWSKDARAWGTLDQADPDFPDRGWSNVHREPWEVPESMLIGKAFFLYWPHAQPFGPDIRVSRDFQIPFRPYFERMGWIR